ncbi:MAG: DNA repair protein RecO [Proteobacteria bacterium]|nr:MAG: DNA repair protein RecO [Pseudomonadota bacterium]
MKPRESITARAIILRTYPFQEADLIIRALSAEHGKISLIAKYARKSKTRFSSPPDIFECGEFRYYKGRGSLLNLQSFKVEDSFLGLRSELAKILLASFVCECFDYLIKEDDLAAQEVFHLLFECLGAVESSRDSTFAARAAFDSITQLLEHQGFSEMKECANFGKESLLLLARQIENIAERQLRTASSLSSLDLPSRDALRSY